MDVWTNDLRTNTLIARCLNQLISFNLTVYPRPVLIYLCHPASANEFDIWCRLCPGAIGEHFTRALYRYYVIIFPKLSFLAFFPCYLHKEIALLLLDYDLQLYILGQLPEQNVLHLQFSIFC